MNRKFDGIFLEFPLSSLIYVAEDKNRIGDIISWCIVNHANKLFCGPEKQRILDAAKFLGVTIPSIKNTLNNYHEFESFISNTLSKDAYCRIGKKLMFESRDGIFDFNQFRVLCAIQSILGKKKKFARITYDRIRYAMQGYRSRTLFFETMPVVKLLTDRQLKRIVDILHSKKFISKFTYGRRQIYFSTRLEDEELIEAVKQSKIYWQKNKLQLKDKIASAEIKKELDYLRLETNYFTQQQRSKLRLVKVS